MKKYFAEDQHNIIEDNRDTPIYVLELKNQQPKRVIELANAVIPVVISFVLVYISTINISERTSALDNPERLFFQLGYFIVIFILGSIIVYYITVYRNRINEVDEEWLIYNFMIALKKGGKKREAVLLYLKNETKKLDKEDIE